MLTYSIIQTALLLLLSLATAYILVFAIAGLFYKEAKYTAPARCRKTAVLIPGYKEDAVIVEVAKAALQQNYAKELFDVVIIADSFQKDTLEKLKALPLVLIEVQFEKKHQIQSTQRCHGTVEE